MESKKSQVGIIIIGIFLFLLLFLGFILVVGSVTIDWVFDEAVPELTNLGMVGSANLTEYSGYTITPVNSIVQSFSWLAGIIYVISIIAMIGMAFAFRMTGNKWLIGLFFCIMIILLLAGIFVSNIYEEFYSDTGDLGTRLKEHTLLSWCLLYSPALICFIGFICGIILFTGEQGGAL